MKIFKEKPHNKRSCVVPTCEHERFDLVHKFPMEAERTEQWLNAVNVDRLWNIPLEKLRSSYFVCSRHFRNEDYKNLISRSLNKTAQPCLNLCNLNDMHLVLHRSCIRPTELQQHSTNDQQQQTTLLNYNQQNKPDDHHYNINNSLLINRKRKFEKHSPELDYVISNYETKTYYAIDIFQTIETSESGLTCVVNVENHDDEHDGHNDDDDDDDNEFNENTVDDKLEVEENSSSIIDDENENHITLTTTEDNNAIEYNHNDVDVDAAVDVAADAATVDNNNDEEDESKLPCDEMDDTIEMTQTLEITHPDYPEVLQLNYFWLRDHCNCKLCYNLDTFQRNYTVLDIPLSIKPLITEVKVDTLLITWEDQHESKYDFKFLFAAQFSQACANATPIERILWDKSKFELNHKTYTKCDFGNFLKNDTLAINVVRSIIQYGFAFIENVPPTVDMTEMTIRRLFPIQKTFFGEMWTFSDKKDHADTAYSKQYLGPHTDNSYFNDAAGLQVFHCTKHIGTGGETILIDGFKVLNDLKFINPIAYEILCETNLPAEYIEEGQHHKYSAPIIKLNPLTNQPEQIRYNMYDRSVMNTLPQTEMQHFYKSLRELVGIVKSPQNEFRIKLNPGSVLIFDNWRLLHGREKYDGFRYITGCYVSRTDYLSKARIFNLIN